MIFAVGYQSMKWEIKDFPNGLTVFITIRAKHKTAGCSSSVSLLILIQFELKKIKYLTRSQLSQPIKRQI